MERDFLEALDRAIAHVVADFQSQPPKFWNERDIHWYLFHYLKQDPVFLKDYGAEPIRAEFPTRALYKEKDQKAASRGQYDMVILDPASVMARANDLHPWAEWSDCLPHMQVVVAVEVKTWTDRSTNIGSKVKWDVEKLTDSRNAIGNAFFLNFVQLDFGNQYMRDFYRTLRQHLAREAGHHRDLRILCVPHDTNMEPDSSKNWVSPPA